MVIRIISFTIVGALSCELKYRTKKQSRKQSNGRMTITRVPRNLTGNGDMIVKKMTIPNVTYASNAGGNIAVTDISSAIVQSFPASEWTSFSARYQQYRVRSLTLVVQPCRLIQDANGSHSEFLVGDFIGSTGPSSAAQLLSDENCSSYSTARPVRHTVTWARNPNAKLWNPTSAAIPTANTFSLALASNTAGTLGNVQTIFSGHVEVLVELRGSQ